MATLSLASVCSIADAVTASPSTTVACTGTVVNRYGVITNRAAYEICHLSSVISAQTSTTGSVELSLETNVTSVCEALACVNGEVSTSFSATESILDEAYTRIKDISVLLSYIARAMDFAEASAETWLSNVELACSLSVPSFYPGACAITCAVSGGGPTGIQFGCDQGEGPGFTLVSTLNGQQMLQHTFVGFNGTTCQPINGLTGVDFVNSFNPAMFSGGGPFFLMANYGPTYPTPEAYMAAIVDPVNGFVAQGVAGVEGMIYIPTQPPYSYETVYTLPIYYHWLGTWYRMVRDIKFKISLTNGISPDIGPSPTYSVYIYQTNDSNSRIWINI